MKLFGFTKIFQKEAASEYNEDFLKLISRNPEFFAAIENSLNDKPISEIISEIQLGWDLLDVRIEEVFSDSDIIIIPPKYEFWAYLFLSINFAKSGYRIALAYHLWEKKIIQAIKKHLNYLQYQNISFLPLDSITPKMMQKSKVLNLSDNFTKAPKLPSFSTVVVTKGCDLDYVTAYILLNAFSFAGIKVSNVKRVLVDEAIRDEFNVKLKSRIECLSELNSTTIRSKQMRQELHTLISESISDGADIFWGNPNTDTLGSLNLVLNNITKGMRIFQKKFFGPVVLLSYLPINIKSLRDTLKQQPSKGVVVFTTDPKFLDLHAIALRDYDVVVRPSETGQNLVFEDNPNLEMLFKQLRVVINLS